MTTTLVRKALEVQSQQSQAESSFSQECERELGYTVPNEEAATAQKLLRAGAELAQLGIEPFTPESVRAYKAEMLKKLNSRSWWSMAKLAVLHMYLLGVMRLGKDEEGEFDEEFIGISLFARIGTYLVSTLPFVIAWHLGLNGYVTSDTMALICLALVTVPIEFVRWCMPKSREKLWAYSAKLRSQVAKYSWEINELAGYKKHVPERVLETALNIKKVIPSCRLVVDELVAREFPVTMNDPFLVVEVDDHRYYVDVWDEADFQKKIG
jgi:hypothetical protein